MYTEKASDTSSYLEGTVVVPSLSNNLSYRAFKHISLACALSYARSACTLLAYNLLKSSLLMLPSRLILSITPELPQAQTDGIVLVVTLARDAHALLLLPVRFTHRSSNDVDLLLGWFQDRKLGRGKGL